MKILHCVWCVCVCVCVHACVCVCECMCVCVRECVCACQVMQERREGGKGAGANAGAQWSKYSDWLSGDHFKPPPPPLPLPSHHLTTTLPSPSSMPRMVAGVRFRVPSASADTVLSYLELEKASTHVPKILELP